MEMSVIDFKAKCTRVFHTIKKERLPVEITRRGKVIAIVQPAPGKDISVRGTQGSHLER